MAAVVVVAVVVVLAVRGGGGRGGGGGTGNGSNPTLPFNPKDFFAGTNVAISPSTGSTGTMVMVNGSGFLPNEGIEIHFHVDVVTQTRFSGVTFAVPQDSFSDQYDVSAVGKQSHKNAQAQFRVT